MRKAYLSVDMEGVACICDPVEINMASGNQYEIYRDQMSKETAAACRGAFAAGANNVVVNDAHWTGRNIDPRALDTPEDGALQVIRGWSGHPFGMVQELDSSFEAVGCIGYHAAGSCSGNPLAHTMNGGWIHSIEINDEVASEFLIYSLAAGSVGVPVTFVSGDKEICDEAASLCEGITTVPILEGRGPSVISLAPDEAIRRVEEGVRSAYSKPHPKPLSVPNDLHCKVTFNRAAEAYKRSFYPNVKLVKSTEVVLETRDLNHMLSYLYYAATS